MLKRLLVACMSVMMLVAPGTAALAEEQCVEIAHWRDCI